MAAGDYESTPDDLVPAAEAMRAHYNKLGYTVRREEPVVGYPNTPTLLCTRGHETVFVEVDTRIDPKRTRLRIGFCRSQGNDTRLVMCVPETTTVYKGGKEVVKSITVPAAQEADMRTHGVGCFRYSAGRVLVSWDARDLALRLELPPLEDMPKPTRKLLGPAYEKFEGKDWREGFDETCQVLEVEARKYLSRNLKVGNKGRIVVLTEKGNPRQLTTAKIKKMTLGQLATAFVHIQNQNHADAQIADVLTQVNVDRVRRAHHRHEKTTERNLRKNVGKHVWSIVAVLQLMQG